MVDYYLFITPAYHSIYHSSRSNRQLLWQLLGLSFDFMEASASFSATMSCRLLVVYRLGSMSPLRSLYSEDCPRLDRRLTGAAGLLENVGNGY